MITLTIFLILLGLSAIYYKFPKRKPNLIKEISKTIKKLTPNNQEVIKSKLFSLLDDYKVEKTQEFTEALCNIRDARQNINKQISNLNSQIYSTNRKLATHPEDKVGAKLLYQNEKLNEYLEKLESTLTTLASQENDINVKLETFSAELALKKAEISTLVLINPLNNNTSHIDTEIKKLVTEFENLQFYETTKQSVEAKIENVETTKDDYDEIKYIEKYKAL